MRLLALFCSLILSISPFLPDNNNIALADLGLDARVVSKEERESLIEDFGIMITRGQETSKRLNSFAIETESSKYIYLAFDDNAIDVYSIQEHYEYSIWFENLGSYEIFCSDGMFFLYIVRGSWVFSFDQDGSVVNVYELNSSSRNNNDEGLDRLCNQTKYEVDERIFEIGTDSLIQPPFSAPFSYLKVTDQDGTSHYLYQTNEDSNWAFIALFVFVFVIVLILLQKQKEKSSDK
jgi:hypothetical protein